MEQKIRASRTSGSPAAKLEAYDVFRLQTLRAFADLELYGLALVQAAVTFRLNGRVVHENIFATLALNEAETLASIKPLHCSLFFH
jgi:hypothetical protein